MEAASALIAGNSRKGGEVQIWLVTAYEAAQQRTEAIALCKQLARHPDIETRKQSKRLLYIMEAPQLTMRPEWLTEIPDLTALAEGNDKFRQGSTSSNGTGSQKQQKEPEPIDLSQVNYKGQSFYLGGIDHCGINVERVVLVKFLTTSGAEDTDQ